MRNVLFSDLAEVLSVPLLGQDLAFTQISIDTRTLEPGDIYLAISGTRFNGHDFMDEAVKKGAIGLICSVLPKKPLAVPIIQVPDTRMALANIARYWQSHFKVPTAAITGSFGKTTVKGMLNTILSVEKKILSTQGNFNNEIGLPLTLLKFTPAYQAAVFEMGARKVGDIRFLMSLAQPTVSVSVSAGAQHLEIFGSLEHIIQEKGEIYKGLPKGACAVLPLDSKAYPVWRSLCSLDKTCLNFSMEQKADIYADKIQLEGAGSQFNLYTPIGQTQINLPVPGKHNVHNALAAASLAIAMGETLETITQGLNHFKGQSQRLETKQAHCGAIVLDDTYNAGLESVKAAIRVLSGYGGKKIFVMGEMGEIGDQAQDFHKKIGEFAKAQGIDQLIGVGPLVQYAISAFGRAGQWYDSKEGLISALKACLSDSDVVLVKGSRFAKMEEVVSALC